MKKCLTIVSLFLLLVSPAFSQTGVSSMNTVHLIDSLAKTNDIQLCKVSAGSGGLDWGGNKHKFSIEKNILILEVNGFKKINKAYYSLDKLVSFYIVEDSFVFNFQ